MGLPFVPVRKPGKLPRERIAQYYQLEYGEDTLEIHEDAIVAGDKVLLVDDSWLQVVLLPLQLV